MEDPHIGRVGPQLSRGLVLLSVGLLCLALGCLRLSLARLWEVGQKEERGQRLTLPLNRISKDTQEEEPE